MKKNLLAMMMAGVMSVAVLAGCGAKGDTAATAETQEATEETVAEETTEAAAEETAEAADNESAEALAEAEAMDEENAEAVLASLTYMGGLYVNGNPDCDMELAIFRRDDGGLVAVVYNLGSIWYGEYTTEDATLDDGSTYEKIKVEDQEFGYYFSEDLTEGILIDNEGNKYDALAMDESVARDLVKTTLLGD
ncbi:MAG: hypothetical protein J6N76_04010 [Lachnospiraceae bacterium]|nr:hypothetical protein [Lachnospiraceae bacterium]